MLEPRHEQQLGHEWVPPKEELLQQELDTFSESGTTTGKSTALESADMGQSDSGKFSATKVGKCFRLVGGEMGQFPTFSSLKIPSGWLVQMRFPFWGCSVQAYFFRDYYDSVREGKKEGRVVRLPISKGNFLELTGLKRWNSSR